MNANTVKKTAIKGLVIFGFSALGFMLLATFAKRNAIAAQLQQKIGSGF